MTNTFDIDAAHATWPLVFILIGAVAVMFASGGC